LGLCALEHGGERPRLLCTEDSATVDSLPQEEGEEASKLPKYLAPIAVGVVASLGSPIIAPALLGAAGFAAAGVVAGSVTVAIQSTFYGGATGGLFAAAQSAEAAGIPTAAAAAAGATAASARTEAGVSAGAAFLERAGLDGYVMPTTVEASKFVTDRIVPAASEAFNLAIAGVDAASARTEAAITAGAAFLERAGLDGYVKPITMGAFKFVTDHIVPAASEAFNLASAGVAVASARAEAGVTAGAEFLERAGLDGYLMPITMGVATTVVATPVAAAVLGAAGFTAGGVAAGSAAAAAQSTFYGGATGGIFAVAQSAGAAGISSLTVGVTGATATVTTAVLQKIPVSYVTETEVYTTAKSTAAAGLSTAKRFVSKVATEAGTEISQKAPEMVTAALRSLSLWQ